MDGVVELIAIRCLKELVGKNGAPDHFGPNLVDKANDLEL